MLDRFNFFDIYAYLFPGAVAIALTWLPYVLLGAALPTGALSGALVILGVAYVAGHVLQTFAKDLWSSKVIWLDGKREYPSHALLDASDATLSSGMKAGLSEHLRDALKLDVSAGNAEMRTARDDAFRMCRTLIKRVPGVSYVSYAEQYQGLYNFMRGCATALLLASFYYIGWMIAQWEIGGYVVSEAGWKIFVIVTAAVLGLRQIALLGSLITPRNHWTERWLRDRRVIAVFKSSLCVLSLGAGVLLAARRSGVVFGSHFVVLPILALVLMAQFAAAYHSLAKEFAGAVYRDYWALHGCPPRQPPLPTQPLTRD